MLQTVQFLLKCAEILILLFVETDQQISFPHQIITSSLVIVAVRFGKNPLDNVNISIKTKLKDPSFYWSCCRRRCAGGGDAAKGGWIWPADGPAPLPDHAGADGGQREVRVSSCRPANSCWLHQHPVPLHWKALRCRPGLQREIGARIYTMSIPCIYKIVSVFLIWICDK